MIERSTRHQLTRGASLPERKPPSATVIGNRREWVAVQLKQCDLADPVVRPNADSIGEPIHTSSGIKAEERGRDTNLQGEAVGPRRKSNDNCRGDHTTSKINDVLGLRVDDDSHRPWQNSVDVRNLICRVDETLHQHPRGEEPMRHKKQVAATEGPWLDPLHILERGGEDLGAAQVSERKAPATLARQLAFGQVDADVAGPVVVKLRRDGRTHRG